MKRLALDIVFYTVAMLMLAACFYCGFEDTTDRQDPASQSETVPQPFEHSTYTGAVKDAAGR